MDLDTSFGTTLFMDVSIDYSHMDSLYHFYPVEVALPKSPRMFFSKGSDTAQIKAIKYKKFNEAAFIWEKETQLKALKLYKFSHPKYLEILAMGHDAVPFILNRLQTKTGHWFEALSLLTGINPIPENATYQQAREAWLKWGKDRQYEFPFV